jgi:hypothetical protein
MRRLLCFIGIHKLTHLGSIAPDYRGYYFYCGKDAG